VRYKPEELSDALRPHDAFGDARLLQHRSHLNELVSCISELAFLALLYEVLNNEPKRLYNGDDRECPIHPSRAKGYWMVPEQPRHSALRIR
jgi:hypothetical protein